MHVKTLKKKRFLLKKCGPQIGFVDVSTFYIETVKKLEFNRYVQLYQRSTGITSECGARGHKTKIQLGQGFLYTLYLLFCCYVLIIWSTGRVPITERILNIFFFYSFFTIFCAIKMKQNQGKFFNFRFQLKMSCLY